MRKDLIIPARRQPIALIIYEKKTNKQKKKQEELVIKRIIFLCIPVLKWKKTKGYTNTRIFLERHEKICCLTKFIEILLVKSGGKNSQDVSYKQMQ